MSMANIPQDVLKKVKLLEIRTRKLVNNLFAGEYHTVFKGQGMTFADFREYVPGDDVRTISWALTARAGKPYIKKFDEERELTLMLAVDVSASSEFGSGEYFKGEVMVHLAALLAFAAVKNKDQVGLVLFSDQVEHYVPPGKGRGHVHRILRDLLQFARPAAQPLSEEPQEPGDVEVAVRDTAALVAPQRSLKEVSLELELASVRRLARVLRAITVFAVIGSMFVIAGAVFLLAPMLPFLDGMETSQVAAIALVLLYPIAFTAALVLGGGDTWLDVRGRIARAGSA